MGRRPKLLSSRSLRILLAGLVISAWIMLAIPLGRELLGQLHLRQGQALGRSGQYAQGAGELREASFYLPRDPEIRLAQGWLQLRIAEHLPGLLKRNMAAQAAQFFRQARELAPLEPETHYGLARSLSLQGAASIEAALAATRQALSLWPNNPLYLRFLAEQLSVAGQQKELLVTLRRLGQIDPGSYVYVRLQPYWGDKPARMAFRQGIGAAITDGTQPYQAMTALAEIKAMAGDWLAAATDYRQALSLDNSDQGPDANYRLGEYLLRGGDLSAAEAAFVQGLTQSSTRSDDLIHLARLYQACGQGQQLMRFLDLVRGRFAFSRVEDIKLAALLVENGWFDPAEQILSGFSGADEYLAEPYFLLSRIAEHHGDWSAMEENARMALSRAPKRSDYHLLLSRTLEHRNYYTEALEAADAALAATDQPTPALYEHRARLRDHLQDQAGAGADREQAAKIRADKPVSRQ